MPPTRSATSTGPRGGAGSSGRRVQLLDIAAEMFATRGYSQTTVRDIAEKAGILSGSLYHHFTSKDEMLTEILHDFMGGLLQRFGSIVSEGSDLAEVFDGLVRQAFRTIHEEPHAVALYQNEAGFLATSPDFAFVAKAGRDVERLWLGVLTDGRDAGVFRSDLDIKLTYRFIRDAMWSTVGWYRPSGRTSITTVADEYLKLLHGGLLHD